MKRKFRSGKLRTMLGTALIVSMLGSVFAGTAFGAGVKDLFEGGKKPRLIVTSDEDWYNLDPSDTEKYLSADVLLASPSAAFLASNSDAEFVTTPSDAFREIEYDADSRSLHLKTDRSIFSIDSSNNPSTVTVTATDGQETYRGEVDVAWNWFEYNMYRYSSDYSRQTGSYRLRRTGAWTPKKSAKEIHDADLTFYNQVGGKITGIKLATPSEADMASGDDGTNYLYLDLTGASLNREVKQRILVELKDGSAGPLIGYCYVTLPMYSKVEGTSCISVESYLNDLGATAQGDITELHIQSGELTKTDWQALGKLPNLKKLYILPAVISKYQGDENAFEGNTTLEEVYFNYSGEVQSRPVRAAAGITNIGNSMFKGCKSLKKVSLPGITVIESSVFEGATALNEVNAPDLREIRQQAFKNCTDLTSLDLPSVYGIGSEAFAGCTALETVKWTTLNWIYANAFDGLSMDADNRVTLVLPRYAPTVWDSFPEGQRFNYRLVDDAGAPLTGSAYTSALKVYAANKEWAKVLDLTQVAEELSVRLYWKDGGTDVEASLTGATVEGILFQVQTAGIDPDTIYRLEVREGILMKEDWDRIQTLYGLRVFKLGEEGKEGDPACSQIIPAGVKLLQVEQALLVSALNVPAEMFKNSGNLYNVWLPMAEEIGDRAFENCDKLKYLYAGETPAKLGKDVFKGCSAKDKVLFNYWASMDYGGNVSINLEKYREEGGQWLPWLGGDTPNPPPATHGTSSGRERASYGSWVQDAGGWKFVIGNKNAVGQWGYLPYGSKFSWYYFDQNGYMVTGWFTDGQGRTYYLHPLSDGTKGHMYTGWNLIDGKWYYFSEKEGSENGMLLKDTMTPDGYRVGENGVWIQ